MRKALLLHEYISPPDPLEEINGSLQHIQQHLLQELSLKQGTIDAKDQEIKHLQDALAAQAHLVEELKQKVAEVQRNNEGNKQLNKKLISEIVRKQQDIEWYKRTYESRSLLGYIKEKLF